MTKVQARRDERTKAIKDLRAQLKPGDTVYTVLRRRAPSGMTRWIDLYTIKDNAPQWLSPRASFAMNARFDQKRESIRVGGCGMDMGFHLVYNLSCALFSDGFGCIGESCPSNDHSNGDRDRTPHTLSLEMTKRLVRHERSGRLPSPARLAGGYHHWHRDGGYALRQRWL